MFELRDLFQWERFITPSIIKIFYWLMVILCLLVGLAGHPRRPCNDVRQPDRRTGLRGHAA